MLYEITSHDYLKTTIQKPFSPLNGNPKTEATIITMGNGIYLTPVVLGHVRIRKSRRSGDLFDSLV